MTDSQVQNRISQELQTLVGYQAMLCSRRVRQRLEEVVEGRPNLVCTLEGRAEGRHLLLCGHTDTVPLNEGDEGVGFSGLVREGWVEGRGSVDMKGGLAAMAAAIVALSRTGAWRKGKVTVAAVIDEEIDEEIIAEAETVIDAAYTDAAAALLAAELIDEANLDAVAAAIDGVWVIE